MIKNKFKVYLDFDGTVVEHDYPRIGRCNFGSIEVIKKLQDAGHEIILNTYRVNCNDNSLKEALKYLNEDYWMVLKDTTDLDLELKPITNYTPSKIHPLNWDWSQFFKYDVIYIDDISANIPLKNSCFVQQQMVDWDELDRQFKENNIY